MSLKYCLKCHEIYEAKKAIHYEGRDYCPECKDPLLYFGKESVSLTKKAYYSEPDKLPWISFRGFYKDYQTQPTEAALLECQTLLKTQPDNIEALYHLGAHYMTIGQYSLAKEYALKILDISPEVILAHQLMVSIFLYEQDWTAAIEAIETLQGLEGETGDNCFSMGIAQSQKGESKLGVTWFLKALDLGIDSTKASHIKQFLKAIS